MKNFGWRIFKNRKAACLRLFHKYYPNYQEDNFYFTQLLRDNVGKRSLLLDAGCGSGKFFQYSFGNYVIGFDMLLENLKENRLVNQAICGNLSQLPFKDSAFDIILCRYTLEHLNLPNLVFSEFNRVSKVDGKLLLITPNIFHYVPLVARFTPHIFHEWGSKLRKGHKKFDIFKTYYKCNTPMKIDKFLVRNGFKKKSLETFESPPHYLIFSTILYRLGVAYERIVNNYNVFKHFRVTILGCYRKDRTIPPFIKQGNK